jgi:hypothetical protein
MTLLSRSLLGLSLAACLVQCKPKEVVPPPTPIKKIYPNAAEKPHLKGNLDNQQAISLNIHSMSDYNKQIQIYGGYFYHADKKVVSLSGTIRPDSVLVLSADTLVGGVSRPPETWELTFLDNGTVAVVQSKPTENKKQTGTLTLSQKGESADFQSFISKFKPISLPFETNQIRPFTQKPASEWANVPSPRDFAFTEELVTGLIPMASGQKFGIYDADTNTPEIHYGYRLNLPDQKIGLIAVDMGNNEYMHIDLYVYDQTGKLLKTSQIDYLKDGMGYRATDFSINADFTMVLEGFHEELGREEVELEGEDGETFSTTATVAVDEFAPFKMSFKFQNNEFVLQE